MHVLEAFLAGYFEKTSENINNLQWPQTGFQTT